MSDEEFECKAYFLKRGQAIRGPLERAAILQAAKARKLLSGDQIATRKDGPWLDITKKPLEKMQQGCDIEIKSPEEWLTIPPKDREELKEWLRANKNESLVVCPFCGESVKHRNLLQHCDKLHYSRLSTTNASLPVSQAATKKSAGKSKNPKVTRYPKNVKELERWMKKNCPLVGLSGRRQPESIKCPHCDEIVASRKLVKHCVKFHFEPKDRKAVLKDTTHTVGLLVLIPLALIVGVWGLSRLGGWLLEPVLELATQGWANSGGFRVTSVCIGIAIVVFACLKLGKKGVLSILGIAYFVFCCWCFKAAVDYLQPEGTLQWFRAIAASGFFVFVTCMFGGGIGVTLRNLIFNDDNDSEGENLLMAIIVIPLMIGFICFVFGGIGAVFLWLYQGG